MILYSPKRTETNVQLGRYLKTFFSYVYIISVFTLFMFKSFRIRLFMFEKIVSLAVCKAADSNIFLRVRTNVLIRRFITYHAIQLIKKHTKVLSLKSKWIKAVFLKLFWPIAPLSFPT